MGLGPIHQDEVFGMDTGGKIYIRRGAGRYTGWMVLDRASAIQELMGVSGTCALSLFWSNPMEMTGFDTILFPI